MRAAKPKNSRAMLGPGSTTTTQPSSICRRASALAMTNAPVSTIARSRSWDERSRNRDISRRTPLLELLSRVRSRAFYATDQFLLRHYQWPLV